MNENNFRFSLIQIKTKKYGEISDESLMTSAMTRCGDWYLNSVLRPMLSRSVSVFDLSERLIQQEIRTSVEIGVCPLQLFFIWNKRNVTFIQFKICCCV